MRPTAASTTDRKTPLCEVLAAAPLNVDGAGPDCPEGLEVVVPPGTVATPATPGTGTGTAGVAVVPAWLAAGVPAARPTLEPDVAKCIGVTASWVENNEVVVQPGAIAPVVATWT